MTFDESMQKDEQMREELAGTTAITVLVKDNMLYCVRIRIRIDCVYNKKC